MRACAAGRARLCARPVPPVIPAPSPSFLRRQEQARQAARALAPNLWRQPNATQAGRQDAKARTDAGARLDSCLRRNDGMGLWGWKVSGGGRSLPPTPHLTSPLKGGRDELGKEWG